MYATCDPGDVRGVGARQPVWRHAVMESERVEAGLEGAHMQRAVRAAVVVGGRRLSEERRGTAAARFTQKRLREFKHEMCRGLAGLVRNGRSDTTLAFKSVMKERALISKYMEMSYRSNQKDIFYIMDKKISK